MKAILKSLFLMFVGAGLMALVMFKMAPSMMVHQLKSPYGVDETVKIISENAKKQGWAVKNVMDMQKMIKGKLKKETPPTKVLKLGQAKYAHTLIAEDETRFVAAMMPHSIAVYEKSDGTTYISSMNMGLMGQIFGGEIANVMGQVQADDDVILKFLLD